MKVKFYGKLGAEIGREIDIASSTGTDTIAQLRDTLAALYPDSADELRGRLRAIVADATVSDSHKLAGQVTVEFFPPLSGG